MPSPLTAKPPCVEATAQQRFDGQAVADITKVDTASASRGSDSRRTIALVARGEKPCVNKVLDSPKHKRDRQHSGVGNAAASSSRRRRRSREPLVRQPRAEPDGERLRATEESERRHTVEESERRPRSHQRRTLRSNPRSRSRNRSVFRRRPTWAGGARPAHASRFYSPSSRQADTSARDEQRRFLQRDDARAPRSTHDRASAGQGVVDVRVVREALARLEQRQVEATDDTAFVHERRRRLGAEEELRQAQRYICTLRNRFGGITEDRGIARPVPRSYASLADFEAQSIGPRATGQTAQRLVTGGATSRAPRASCAAREGGACAARDEGACAARDGGACAARAGCSC